MIPVVPRPASGATDACFRPGASAFGCPSCPTRSGSDFEGSQRMRFLGGSVHTQVSVMNVIGTCSHSD